MKTSDISLKKDNFIEFLSYNPLSPAQWEFLSLGDPRQMNDSIKSSNQELEEAQRNGRRKKETKESLWNISDYQTVFYKKLAERFREILWIIKQPHNLKNENLHEIFNAKTMELILKPLLENNEFDKRSTPSSYQYDFVTAEKARLMLEISLSYLKNSIQFIDNVSIKENIDRISADFESLSYSLLMKEKPNEQIIESNKEKSFEVFNDSCQLTGMLNDEYPFDIDDAINMNKEKMIDVITEISRIKILIEIQQNKKLIETYRNEYDKLIKQFNQINDDYLILKQIKLQNDVGKKLDVEPYAHLEKFFSNVNTLKIENMWKLKHIDIRS